MSHAIQEGPVILLKIVTPGAYWIRCKACEGSSRVPSSIKRKLNGLGSECYYPHQGEKVFVKDDDGFFYRGTVCGRREVPESVSRELLGTWKYVVQLTDTFQVKDFFQHDVYPSYGEFRASCSSAHLISIYYVLPQMPPATYGKCVKIGTGDHVAFENVVTNWDHSVEYLACLTENRVNFTFEQSKLINGCVYGELLTFPPLRTQSSSECNTLSDYLHLEKLAVRTTYRFDDVVAALMANALIDCSALLATFDPLGETTFKPKPALPLDKPPEPRGVDFAAFKIHPGDVELYQSLIQGLSHLQFIKIFFLGEPLEDDPIVRFVSADGKVILGTVIGISVMVCEAPSENTFPRQTGFAYAPLDDKAESPESFNDIDFSDSSDEPENYLLPYNFDESYENFKAGGGVFEQRFLPYLRQDVVEGFIHQHLKSLGVEGLHEWQKLSLTSLSLRKNLIVVGPKSTGRLSTAVISALSWMRHATSSNSVHPQLIIFFSDMERADKTACLCSQLKRFRMIVSTSSNISLKQRELAKNGCDVLITTPSNWAELVSLKVFDYSQIQHMVFDEFDKLNEIYAQELKSIFQALELSSNRRQIQAIAVSNSWSEFMMTRIADAVICITDVLQSCNYYKLTMTAVFVKHDDWKKQLEGIIRKRPGKCLLLCKDKLEGKTIKDQISCNEDVLCVHEMLHEETARRIVKEWDRHCDKVLICTDRCFEWLGFVKNVDVLLSWKTTSRTTLSNRFLKAFINNFGFNSSLSSASAYLFCDADNLDELLLVRNVAPKVHFINGSLDEHIRRASFKAEKVKRSPICPSIFMFGWCNDEPACPHRHLLRIGDDPQSSHLSQFLKVNILKVHSAFMYSVRVTEIVSNHHRKVANRPTIDPMVGILNTLITNLKEIEEGLMKCCKKPCSSNLKMENMVGVSVIREGKTLLRRAIVKFVPEDTSSGLFLLSIVDYEEPDVRLPLSQLFVLPKEVAKHPKDVVDVYVSGLLPADFKSDWKNDTASFFIRVMKELKKEPDFFAGKVHLLTADRSVVVDTLHCYREDVPGQRMVVSLVDSEFCTLKHLILESGYCVENVEHLPLLSELIRKSAASSYDSIPPLKVNRSNEVYSPHYLLLNHIGKFGFRTNFPSGPVQAVVSSFEDPGLLFVQLIAESEKLEKFENALSSTMNSSKELLHFIAVDEICAMKYQGTWNRAVICDIIGDLETPVKSVHIIFVDHGDTLVNVQPNELHCLPYEFVDVPFFAIRCELVGIKPLVGEEWCEETIDKLKSCVRTPDDTMKAVEVQFHRPKNVSHFSKFSVTQMAVLWELHQLESINFCLVRKGFASFDDDTRHLLKRK